MYDELRRLAAAKLANEKPGQTLQATALVHEAYLRLVDQTVPQQWDNHRHFFAAAAEAMRRILVERARRNIAQSTAGIASDWMRNFTLPPVMKPLIDCRLSTKRRSSWNSSNRRSPNW